MIIYTPRECTQNCKFYPLPTIFQNVLQTCEIPEVSLVGSTSEGREIFCSKWSHDPVPVSTSFLSATTNTVFSSSTRNTFTSSGVNLSMLITT